MIELKNVVKSFKTRNRSVRALDGVSLSLPPSGMVFVLGESGAGKSTLLNLISLQDAPTSGKVLIDGRDTSGLSEGELSSLRNSCFGIMFQDGNLIEDFTVYQNLSLALEIQGSSLSREDANSFLASVGLPGDILDERPSDLSGGQCQRVCFARSALKGSRVLICDEPTGSLDPKSGGEVMGLLKSYSGSKLVIVVTHDSRLADEYADRVIRISHGCVEEDTGDGALREDGASSKAAAPASTRPRFPFRGRLRLAARSFSGLVGKTAVAFVSLFITLSCLMSALALVMYSPEDAIRESIRSNGIDYVMVTKMENLADGQTSLSFFSEQDISDIENIYGKDYLLSSNNEIEAQDKNAPRHSFYTKDCVLVNEDNIKNFGFDIVGSVPEENLSSDQVMLTSYECYLLGWIKYEDMSDSSNLNKIINNDSYQISILLNDVIYRYKLSGIIDTHYVIPDSNNDNSMYNSNQKSIEYSGLQRSLFLGKSQFNVFLNGQRIRFNYEENRYSSLYCATINDSYFKIDELNKCLSAKQSGFSAVNSSVMDSSITQTNDFMSFASKAFSIIAIVFLTIFFFSFYSFIKSSVDDMTPTMKTLKSIGLANRQIYSIFVLQSSIISVVASFLSTFAYLTLVLVESSYRVNNYYLINPFYFNFLVVLVCFAGCWVFSSLMAYVSSLIAFRKKKIR